MHAHRVAGLVGGDAIVERRHVIDIGAIDRLHHIARLHTGMVERPARKDLLDEDAAAELAVEEVPGG